MPKKIVSGKCATFRPTSNYVLVRPDDQKTETAAGILLPDVAQEPVLTGVVLAVGPGYLDKKGRRVPMTVQPGNRVTFSPVKNHVEILHDGKLALIMREPEVYLIHS